MRKDRALFSRFLSGSFRWYGSAFPMASAEKRERQTRVKENGCMCGRTNCLKLYCRYNSLQHIAATHCPTLHLTATLGKEHNCYNARTHGLPQTRLYVYVYVHVCILHVSNRITLQWGCAYAHACTCTKCLKLDCRHVYVYAYMYISYMCIGVLLFFADMRMCMHGCICVCKLPQTALQICICVHVYILHVYVCSTVCCGYAYVYACMHLRVRVASHYIAHMCMNTCYCPSGMCMWGYSARGCVYYCTMRQCVEECVYIYI